MFYEVQVASAARRQFRKLPLDVRDRIGEKLSTLRENPRPEGVKKLQGSSDRWRIRIGDYRVIYRIEDDNKIVIVLVIAHRRDVYRP